MRFDRCLGCMEKLETENAVCPHCGFDITHYEEAEYALRPGTLLQGKYMIGKVLGKGGFGITYIGFDMMLDIKVAIKEYYPEGFVGRDSRQSSKLTWYSTRSDVQYVKNSRDNLLKEARNMAKIDTFPTVARVREVFMANETAYLVMDYIEGETLKDRVMKNGVLTYGELRNYLCPVMADLAQIHEKGIIHRDISPDNIMVEPTGKARLLDLGAAKDLYQPAGAQTGQSEEDHGDLEETQMIGAGENTQNIRRSEDVPKSTQMVLKKGFSPLEQYRMHGEIGPWTDVYAMAATMYYLLSGRVLPTPMDRLGSEEEEKRVQDRINGLEIPEKAKEGMRKGLAILKKDRIGSMRELLEYLPERDQPKPEPVGPTPDPRKKWPFVLLGAAILAVGGYAAMTGLQSTQKKAEQYYEEGNYEEALAAYREDGDTENVERVLQAMYDLAEDYRTGSDGYEKNEEEAIRYYKLVAEDESAGEDMIQNAWICLGYIMSHNESEEDDAEAAFWFEKAKEKGSVNAITYLGWMYGTGTGVMQDYEKAVEFYRQAAEAGEANAMNNLGIIYEYEKYGQKKNLQEALKWYKLAAEKDYDGAQESVVRVEQALQKKTETERSTEKTAEQYYEEGNYEEALTAYREAGDTENVERVLQAMYDLAGNYKDGKNGVEKNEEEAIRYFKLVAEDESAEDNMIKNACYQLGCIMSNNEAEEDDTEAVSWFEKAKEKGDVRAINSLGWMYERGKGVVQDDEKAIELYRQAADAGSKLAMNNLGIIYENGKAGQEVNLEEALKWYKLAAENGYDGAQESVARVEQTLQKETESDRSTEKTAEQYYEEGNYEETLTAYREAGDTENVERVLQTIYDLAWNYKDGKNGVEKNEEEAIRYFKLVAEDESVGDDKVRDASFYLGYIMSKNEAEEDDTEAASWFEKAIEKGSVSAITWLGWMYGIGKGVTQDYEKAIELYKQAADAGEDEVMNFLGFIYEYGQYDQEINLEEALKWYKLAAEKNQDGAQESVARVEQALQKKTETERSTEKTAEQYYEEGNYEEALTAYREAGDTENVERILQAIFDLAENYKDGKNGVEKNEEEAIRYYELVAEDESSSEINVEQSCFYLGYLMTRNETDEDDSEAAAWYEKAIEKGMTEARFNLAAMYEEGQGVAQDYEKAISLYTQQADEPDAFAMMELGRIYENGECGQKKDLEEALKWYEQAANHGAELPNNEGYVGCQRVLQAMYELAEDYRDGSNGAEKNEEEAIRYFKLLAEDESAGEDLVKKSCTGLGKMLANNTTKEDDAEAVSWYEKAAEKGDLEGTVCLGTMYQKGQGVAQDYEKAAELYRQAADGGNADGINKLAGMYRFGQGVTQDSEKAVELYNQAINKGSIDALNSLGAMYEWGSAGTTDYAKALELYHQAADGGCADALKNLGGMYEQGWGVSQDYEKAAELYQKAAELFQKDADNGDAVAMYSLGGMYEKGRGIAQDNQKALELYHQAAERENAEAMNWLGHIYEEGGLGQQINLEEALKWYRLAAEKHYSGAWDSVDRVSQMMN